MSDINVVTLSGHFVEDPVVQNVGKDSQYQLIRTRIAENQRFRKEKADKTVEYEEHTQYHTIEIWGALTKYVMRVGKKGLPVSITGRLNNSSYDNPKYHDAEGKTKKDYSTTVVVSQMTISNKFPKSDEGGTRADEGAMDAAAAALPNTAPIGFDAF